ncbi:5-enolpyruvylshikimate-3-phosphate synthase [hydrocarbon metagenome]|uniref:3-phosphoshikimate 1-carboxyvinyltransferase n=1 Tax=hydrocarbon metagenome TaxID=938273 RepID=A0A0W8FJ71_9ZZZZ|nr:3-phosphoshikimate 1-carboxyvinyltransferase [Methanomicrobiaceae archaeon]
MDVTISRVQGVDLRFSAPPSKSYTHRALIAGALASGTTEVIHPLYAGDTALTAKGLGDLGVQCSSAGDRIRIAGCNGRLACREGIRLDLGNSGTSLRLLTSVALLCPHPVVLTGNQRMLERPVGALVEALNALGGEIVFEERPGFPPIQVKGRLRGGRTRIDGSISSQFISSILMAAPYADEDVELHLAAPPASRSYIDLTTDVMHRFGARLERKDYTLFCVRSGVSYRGTEYTVEGDYSSASYLFAVGAICGGRVCVENLNPASPQGDRQFLTALAEMGCRVAVDGDGILLERTGELAGIEIDMSSSPDTVQTLCMVAAVASSPTTITGIGHLRYKESDRVRATAEILRRMGAGVLAEDDRITITPASLHGISIDPVDDHRTAMSLAVLGLGTGGVTIRHAECVEKSFPEFWNMLRGAGLL